MTEQFVVTTFYKFVDLPDFIERRVKFVKFCNENNIKGTILLGEEGINSTLTATRENIDKFYSFLKSMPEFADMDFKESFCPYLPFKKMKVRLKKEIVKISLDKLNMKSRGRYLDSEKWNELIKNPETKVIDTRNDYEVVFGTFENAINPKIRNFHELPEWVEKNLSDISKDTPIAMFCTGGIRCEKSTAYMMEKGYTNVFHLEGGILKYFEERKDKENLWNGRCFVFDDRIAVNKDLTPYCDKN